ncbi:MAG: hypothetical protein K1X79_10465 [Oligoflexia bacterium]|nr:hypothetical protein [Oligoflexia bacterium]
MPTQISNSPSTDRSELPTEFPRFQQPSKSCQAFFAQHKSDKSRAFPNQADSSFTREILYYGVDAVILGSTATLALCFLEKGITPSTQPIFKSLFSGEPTAPALVVPLVAQALGIYIPTRARELDTIQGFTFRADHTRHLPLLSSDYINPLCCSGNNPLPAQLITQAWNLHDFDDQGRAAALLIVATELWKRSSATFQRREMGTNSQAAQLAIGTLMANYDSALSACWLGSAARRSSLALGTSYITQMQKLAKQEIEFDEIGRELQLAEFARRNPEKRAAALATLQQISQRLHPLAARARSMLDLGRSSTSHLVAAIPATTPIPVSPPSRRTTSADRHAPKLSSKANEQATLTSQSQLIKEASFSILSSDPDTRESGAGILLELRRSVLPALRERLSAALRAWNRVLEDLKRLDALQEEIEAAAASGDNATVDSKLNALANGFKGASRPAFTAARQALKLLRENLSRDGKSAGQDCLIHPEGPGDTQAYRAALLQASREGLTVSITMSSGLRFRGRAIFGDINLREAVVMDPLREWSRRVRIDQIEELSLRTKA